MSNEAPEIGATIRQARIAQGLTLDQLSATAGVSKSMLSQIEREQVNPTFAVLWSVTRALGMEIGALTGAHGIGRAGGRVETVRPEGIPEMRTRDGLCTLRILSPPHLAGTTEWYDVTIEPGGVLDSPPHARGAFEHLTVQEGAADVTSGGDTSRIAAGEIARYNADVAHRIAQAGETRMRGLLVVLNA